MQVQELKDLISATTIDTWTKLLTFRSSGMKLRNIIRSGFITRVASLQSYWAHVLSNKVSGGCVCVLLRIFVATWNVAGRCPHSGFNLEDFLQVEESSDIYVIGYDYFYNALIFFMGFFIWCPTFLSLCEKCPYNVESTLWLGAYKQNPTRAHSAPFVSISTKGQGSYCHLFFSAILQIYYKRVACKNLKNKFTLK